jgi:hypothetical protein
MATGSLLFLSGNWPPQVKKLQAILPTNPGIPSHQSGRADRSIPGDQPVLKFPKGQQHVDFSERFSEMDHELSAALFQLRRWRTADAQRRWFPRRQNPPARTAMRSVPGVERALDFVAIRLRLRLSPRTVSPLRCGLWFGHGSPISLPFHCSHCQPELSPQISPPAADRERPKSGAPVCNRLSGSECIPPERGTVAWRPAASLADGG